MVNKEGNRILKTSLILILVLDIILTLFGFLILYHRISKETNSKQIMLSLVPFLKFVILLSIIGIVGVLFDVFSITITFSIIKLFIFTSSLNYPFTHHNVWDAVIAISEIIISFAISFSMLKLNHRFDTRLIRTPDI